VRNFDLKELHLWLLNGEVRHFDVKTMEVNSADTLFDVLRELALTDLIEPLVIGKGGSLMEFTEEFVHLEGAVVEDEFVPEGTLLDGAHLLVVIDDLLEIPGEGKNIGMLLLIECHVNTDLLVSLINVNSILFRLLELDLGGIESAGNAMALKRSGSCQKRHHSALGTDKSCLSAELSHN